MPNREQAEPFLSVIIPTFQRRIPLMRALDSLGRQSLDPSRFEVVVVIDGSTDGTAESLRSCRHPARLIVIEQENSGKAAAVNAGTLGATGDVLLILDDDMTADPRMLEEHLRAYRELEADAAMGLIVHDSASPVNVISEQVRRDFEADVRALSEEFGLLPAGRALVGAQLSVRRAVFESVGGLDDSFTRHGHYGHGDEDLGIRLRAVGARIVFNGGAISRQLFVKSFDSIWRQHEEYGRADVRLSRKHGGMEAKGLWPLPPRGTLGRILATATLRHPVGARWLGELTRPLARALHDRGATGPLARKLTYTLLFHHRYWLGVAEAGGGSTLGVPNRPELLALAYHAFTPPGEPKSDRHATTRNELLQQVGALLREGFELVTPEDVAGHLGAGHGLPRLSLLITFDDGYRDVATDGSAVLRTLGAKGVAFVVSGRIGGQSDWSGVDARPMLTEDQVRELAAEGVLEVGAHSRTHPELTCVPHQRLIEEVEGPIEDLVRLGLPAPRFMAYPFGDHDAVVREAASGRYIGAFTVDPGLQAPQNDPWRLPRISVPSGTRPEDLVRQVRSLRRERRLRAVARAVRRASGSTRANPGAGRGGPRST